MSEDRTTPNRQEPWLQPGTDLDDRETEYANMEGATPPTLPLGDQGGWGAGARQGFAPTAPPHQDPGAAQDQTMVISERPTPVFAWLVVVDGPDRHSIGTVHVLKPDNTTLGRVAGNHIIVRDETCSAQHARIRTEPMEGKEPTFVLYDMGARNGTFIGDKESYKSEENRTYRHELQDGDYLLVGETTLVFKRL